MQINNLLNSRQSGGVLQGTSTISSEHRPERNYGIDLLRIYAMFLVVILHLLGHGGIIENTTGTANYVARTMSIFACCAVDIFALISGYVGYSDTPHQFKSSKFISMWTQVFCYSFGITLCAFLIKPESIGIRNLIRSAFPVASEQYWYFCRYAALMLLMPWLNHFIRSMTKKQMTGLVALLGSMFSLYMVFCFFIKESDPFILYSGFSLLWLAALYFIGAWMKRCRIPEKISKKAAWCCIAFCVVLTWFFTIVLDNVVFDNYTNPTVLLTAMAYIVIFDKIKVKGVVQKCVAFVSPAVFGVYLIHEKKLIRNHFISQFHNVIAMDSAWMIFLEVLLGAIVVMAVCLLIEKFRQWLFRVLKINHLIACLGEKIDGWICSFLWKMNYFLEIE